MKKDIDYVERQIFILGKSIRLVGTEGDSYFEALSSTAEPDILNILTVSIFDDDWVLDVGANIGYISLAMSTLCSKGKVFAFEPGKKSNSLLKKNISLNKRKNIKISSLGLSDTNVTSKLSFNLSNSSGAFVNKGVTAGDTVGHGSDAIELARLDDEYKKLGITKCSFIKVDIEGHEPDFLSGATAFIKKFKPQALMEVNHWCLNVFNRTSLPDFIEQTYQHFPYIFAFYEGNYLDLSDEDTRYKFYYENVVNNTYQNVYCGFDRNEMLVRLNSAFGTSNKAQKLVSEQQVLEMQKLLGEKIILEEQIQALRNSRPQKIASKINRMMGR